MGCWCRVMAMVWIDVHDVAALVKHQAGVTVVFMWFELPLGPFMHKVYPVGGGPRVLDMSEIQFINRHQHQHPRNNHNGLRRIKSRAFAPRALITRAATQLLQAIPTRCPAIAVWRPCHFIIG